MKDRISSSFKIERKEAHGSSTPAFDIVPMSLSLKVMVPRRRVPGVSIGYIYVLSLVHLSRSFLYNPIRRFGFLPGRAIFLKERESVAGSDETQDVEILQGSWNSSRFGATGCWCRRPLFLRGAFPNVTEESSPLPSWQQILDMACCASREEDQDMADALTCRLIQHVPGRLDSFTIEFGPFDNLDEINDLLLGNNHERVSTLVVNDVDRWIPDLSDWMDGQFDFLPRWRRDDAQVSLAARGGGIGPHVDNYDVFLIQTSGRREWEVGIQPISVEQEYNTLVEASQVRILNMTEIRVNTVKLTLEPGDCLYLPPRFIHCGIADSDDCATLSVGCRAPSAADLLSKLAETVAQGSMELATRRYVDEELFDPGSLLSGGLTEAATMRMKDLVLELVEGFVKNEEAWGELVGKTITEPNRPIMDYPIPLCEMDSDWKAELGVWGSGATALISILSGNGALRRADGIAFAWSYSEDSMAGSLYAQGRSFHIKTNRMPSEIVRALLDRVSNGPPITKTWLDCENVMVGNMLNPEIRDFLCELLEEGLIYGEESLQI
jgi:50S ribosomal protein L16 3-hydroxylase